MAITNRVQNRYDHRLRELVRSTQEHLAEFLSIAQAVTHLPWLQQVGHAAAGYEGAADSTQA